MNRTHGMSGTRIYTIWESMMARCTRPSHNRYANYGARGITVCPRWRRFSGFYEDMGPTYRDDLTIERIDTNGPYSPENCRWATQKEQQRNRTNNLHVRGPWGDMTLGELSERTGISYWTLKSRRDRGWPDEKLALRPKKKSTAEGGKRLHERARRKGEEIHRAAESV